MINIILSGALQDKGKKIQVQTEFIEKQKWEIENLKSAKAMGVSLQQLVTVISQAMSYLYVGNKRTTPSNTNGGNKFMGTSRPPKPSAGVDGSLDNNLTYQYCKQLQNKCVHEQEAMQSIVPEELLNTKCY